MLKPFKYLLLLGFMACQALAGPVPGTSVSLSPPPGFVAAGRFAGFMQESSGASIMVSELPGPYAEVTAGFGDAKRMKAQGLSRLSQVPIQLDGHAGMLLDVRQSAHGTVYRKWMLAVDRSGTTLLILATYPEAEKALGARLKEAILGATFVQASPPADALAFQLTPSAPFQVATLLGQTLVLTPGGRFPVRDEQVPFMVAGLSASGAAAVADPRGFAERRVSQVARIRDIRVRQTTPVTIGNLSGFTTVAEGTGEGAGTPLTIHQVILFDPSGYALIQGVGPTAEQAVHQPVFEQMAATFRLKAPAARPAADR